MIRRLPLLLMFWALPAAAQQPYLDMAPLRLSVGTLVSDEATTVALTVDRSVPLFFFLPNVGRDSHVDVGAVSAGIRMTDDRNTFRYRITALDLRISRPPGNGGFTLLSYDRSGTRDVVADWIGLHAGPDVRLDLGGMSVEPRIVFAGSVASRRPGRSYFSDLGSSAADGAVGFAGSVSGEVTIAIGDALRIEGSAGIERFSAGSRPEHRHLLGALHVTVATRFELVARGGVERAVVAGSASDATLAGFALRFTPAAQAY